MSISFSGLATGLDTSSWVESLVKIKQEKVSSYESTKKTLELTQEAVASIKSFFTSFRSVLEKVTDTKFGTAASDIFAQKLASSTNANLVSASATNEAEEAKYDVNVDKLATQTKANSGIKQLETITQIQTATLNTKLGDLGVKNGTIDVTVKGVKNNITISEENSIADFITKLKSVGVDSNFNEKTGVFSIDLPSGNIVDNGTSIIDAFHLQSSGYESTNLVTYTTSTVTSTATGNTQLSELDTGKILENGIVEVNVNGATYTISVDGSMTLSEFVGTLKNYGADAELADDGTLTIKDATITDIGNTKLLDVLGLHSDVSSKSQTAEGLKTTTIITTGIEATGATTLGELDGWKNISGTPQLVAVDAQGNTTTVEFTETSTLDEVVSALNNAGLKAELKNGTLSVTEGSVSGNVAEVLGLTDNNIGRVSTTGKNLYTTMVTKATGDTKLADLGIKLTYSGGQPLIQIDPQANSYTITSDLDADMTINDYFAILKEHGINASISDGKITVEQNGHYDSGTIAQALGLNYSTTTLVTANSAASTAQISYTITQTVDESTTFGELGLAGLEYDIKDSAGNPAGGISGHSVSSDTTFADFISKLKEFGITLSLNNGVISLSTDSLNHIVTGDLAEALGIQTVSTSTSVTTGQSVTSTDALTYTTSVVATGSSKISDFVNMESDGNYNYNSIRIVSKDNSSSIYVMTSSTTFNDLISTLSSYGISASMVDGTLQISNTDGAYIKDYYSNNNRAILSKLGISTTTLSITTTIESTAYTGSTLYYTTSESATIMVTGSTKLTDLGCSIGSFNIFDMRALNSSGTTGYQYFTTTSDTTVNDFISWLESKGFSGSGIYNGQITVGKNNNSYISWVGGTSTYDDFFKKLGLSTSCDDYATDTTRYVYGNTNSNKQEKVTTYTATSSTTLGTLGLVGDGTIVLTGTDPGTITVSASDTIDSIFTRIAEITNYSIANFTDGKFVLGQDNSSEFVASMSDNLKNVLKLAGVGNGYTYTVDGETTYENVTDGRTLTTTKTELINENTVIKNIDGYNHGDGTIKIKDYNDSSVDITITINQDGTLGDFFAQLRANGLTASVSNGQISISDPDGGLHPVYVDGGSNILSRFIQAGESATTTIYNATTDGRTITDTQTVAVTGSTKLKDLFDADGNRINCDSGTLKIEAKSKKDGTVVTDNLNFSSDDTLDKIFANLAFDFTITDGKIHISSDNLADFSFSSDDSNIVDILFGDYKKTYDIASDLNTQTVTTAVTNATRDTLLKDLGVTSGEYYVYNNGVRYTALISDDETIGSFMDNLKSFGLQTGLMNTDDGAKLMIIGNGDSYIAKSNSTTNASNVVEKLFSNITDTKYNYIGTENVTTTSTAAHEATKDTLLSEFDLRVPGAQGYQWLRNEGSLIFDIRGESKTISIASTETFGFLVDKLNDIGIASSFHDGKLYISDAYDIVHTGGTSQLLNILAIHTDSMSGFMASGDEVQETTTQIVEKDLSAANYADYNTVLGKLNIADGTFSIFRNGQKTLIDIDSTKTFGDLRSQIAAKFSDVDLKFEDGKLVIYSKTDGVTVEAGTTTDTSNLQAVVGLVKDESGMFSKSTRELYRVSTDTLVTAGGMFRLGDVTEGTFTVGNQEITIDKNTKLSDIINQINNSEAANATAYWDSIGGRLVIQSRTTGAALINIEAGTSNFTDIMGYTNSNWNSDGSLDETRLSFDNQELGSNAKFTINGTKYSATSNTITSDITKIKGLTLNLKDITENNPVTITIENDKDKVANAIESVVDSYNELMKNVDEQISTTGKLHDQSTLKMIRNQLRTMMTGSDAGATVFSNLSAIGISVSSASANNTSTSNESIIDLSFDRDKFLEAYAKDADAVKALLVGGASNQGVFTKVENLLESSLKSVTGYFDVTEKSIKSDINKTAMKITKANEAIERYRAQLEKRFSSMNMMIAGMQQQYSSFLQS